MPFSFNKSVLFCYNSLGDIENKGGNLMADKKKQGKSKWALWLVFILYVVELLWFFYSQFISKIVNGQPIDFESKELAVILVIGLLAIIIFFVLKKSKKVGGILISVLIGSVFLFGVLAPLLDVYIPVIWKIFSGF